ncbi:MAG TPA: ATP-binding protein [Acidimicrobiia bacterium]|nr:ATP-binding protein [Acidimicrobiia bacterium]
MTSVRTSLEPSLTSVGAARRFVRDVLITRQVDGSVVDVVELLTSEVVTNALLHARSAEELVVELHASCVRVAITDSSCDWPVRRSIEPDAVSGRGIAIVDALAHAWGVDPISEGGKRVWFEVVR